jgi:anti-sigma regulatory factor (Ser/Thr protein kinase)
VTVTTATRPHDRYVHEAVYYATAGELVEATAPLLEQALSQGDDVALACSDAHNAALIDALGDGHRISVLPRGEIYTKAVTAVAYFRDFVQERISAGAPRVCVLGEVDFGAEDRALDEWRRYEALLNHALSPFPLWSLCGYDTRRLDEPTLIAGEMTHPYLRRGGVQAPNSVRVDPSEVLRLADADRTPEPGGDPSLVVSEVHELGELHRQAQAVLLDAGLSAELVDDLVVALHEVTINALRHGRPPVTLRLWVTPERVQCAVTDRGPGFRDPFVGYVRGGGDELPEGKFGLWLARRLCDEVILEATAEGFTTRLVVDL